MHLQEAWPAGCGGATRLTPKKGGGHKPRTPTLHQIMRLSAERDERRHTGHLIVLTILIKYKPVKTSLSEGAVNPIPSGGPPEAATTPPLSATAAAEVVSEVPEWRSWS